MNIYFQVLFTKTPLKVFVWVMVFCLLLGQFIIPSTLQAQTIVSMPEPGLLVGQSVPFVPAVLKGVSIHPDQPFYFDFLVDKGDTTLNDVDFKSESVRLIKYFMASLAIPENDLWVNLSPHEQNRIIPEEFGLTEMGRDLLSQDYLLKQFTASLMYPENELGKEFWDRVYKKAYQKYRTTDIPVDTFNKVWVLPDKAVIYEKDNTAYIVESTLKVMLDQDYQSSVFSSKKNAQETADTNDQPSDNLTSEIVKEILIPEIEREVNEGKHFARLRQIYHSLILATWYKENIRQSLVNQVYSDQNKIAGIDLEDKQSKIKIYNQYLESFKKGVYNYIREDYDQYKDQVIPRQYFSGGMKIKPTIVKSTSFDATTIKGDMAMISTRFDLANGGRIIDENVADQAQNGESKESVGVIQPVKLADVNDLYAHIMGQLWDPLTVKPFSRGKFAALGKKWNDQWTQVEYDRYRSLPAQLMLFTWYDSQENKVLQFEENLAALIDTAFDDEKLKAYWARGIKTIYHLRFQGNHPENFRHEYLDHYILQDTLTHYLTLLLNHDPETVPLEYLWGLAAMLDPMIYHPHFLKDNWNKDFALTIPSEQAQTVMHDKTRALMRSLLARFDQDKLTRLIQRAFSITPQQWEEAGFRSPYTDFANDNGGFFFLFRKIALDPDEALDQIFLLARSRAYIDDHVTFVEADGPAEKDHLFAKKRALADVEPNALLDAMRKIVSTVTEKIEHDPGYYYQMVYGSESFRQATGIKFEFAQLKDESMMGAIDQFMERRSHELEELLKESTDVAPDKARILSVQWRSAIMKEWYDGETIVQTDDELGEIGERLNTLWKKAGFDRYASWPAQMMLLSMRQLNEDKYYNFVKKQEALISRATPREKLTAYWLNGVKYVSHLRYYGNHPEDKFQKPYVDNETLIDITQKYITLLVQEDLDTVPLEYLWGLIMMLDPFVHHPDFRIDNWDDVIPSADVDPQTVMNEFILRIFDGLQGDTREKLKAFLTKAFSITDQQWADQGFRSPYIEFAGHNFNLNLGDIFNEFYLKKNSQYDRDIVFVLAKPEQFFLENFSFRFNTRDSRLIRQFLFSNERNKEPRTETRHIFTSMNKARALGFLKKDPRYYYKQIYAPEKFQLKTGITGIADAFKTAEFNATNTVRADSAVMGENRLAMIEKFSSSVNNQLLMDFVRYINLPPGSRIKIIGAAENPQMGIAFALKGYDVQSITLDLKGTTIEEALYEIYGDTITTVGGNYKIIAGADYIDLPPEEIAPAMIVVPNVLDDPKTVSQDKMIDKMFQEIAEGGYLVFDFIIDKEYWYNRMESYAEENGYIIKPQLKLPYRGTVYKVITKPVLVDAAMTSQVTADTLDFDQILYDLNSNSDEAMFAFLRKNHRVLKRALGKKDVTLENLRSFIYEKLSSYPLTADWTRISDLDHNENDIVRRAVFEWMHLKGMADPTVKYELLEKRLYVRKSDRAVFFRKEYAPNSGRYVITGGLEDIDFHIDLNNPVREALGIFLGQKLQVNTTETVITPQTTFSRFMMDGDEQALPQSTMQGAESSALVLHVFIRNSNDVKVFQRSLIGETFFKFDFDQGFNRYFANIERLVDFYIGVSQDERAKVWENWFAQDFDLRVIRETIQKVKGLNLDGVREEFIQSLPDEFDKDAVRREVEPYFALLKTAQERIDQDVARMYRFFTSVDLPPINQEDRRSGEDNAVMAKEVGGIDFTSNKLDLEIRRDQNGLPIPLSDQQLQNIQIDGLVPVIIQIQPVTNLPLLIGTSKTNPAESKPIRDISFPRKEAIIKENEYASSTL